MALNEVRRSAIGFEAVLIDRDGLKQNGAAWPQAIVERLKIVRPKRLADGFNHFDRHDAIEGAGDVTVVAKFKRDLVLETILTDAPLRMKRVVRRIS